MTPILEVAGLYRELGAEVKTPILRGIDLSISRGEFVSLTGPSGSGKSTLLYLLGALDRPSAGRIEIDGVEIGQLDDDARARLRGDRLGFVFQFHFLIGELSVLENVLLPMLRRGAFSIAEAVQRARRTLDRLGLGALAQRMPGQLSGGQQQRVSIARAIAGGPQLLFADEPTGNLDSANSEAVMQAFEDLVREERVTLVMVTHEPSFAARAHRQIHLTDGRIVRDQQQHAPS